MAHALYNKILVVRIGNIGDVLFVTPLLKRLRSVFPKSTIEMLTSPQAAVVLEHNPHLNAFYIYKKFHKGARWLKRRLLLNKLRRRQYDLCIVLESGREYVEFSYRAAHNAFRVGIASSDATRYLDKSVEFLSSRHAAENYLEVLKLLSIESQAADRVLEFFIPQAKRFPGPYAVVHPACTKYLPYRGWPLENFQEVVNYLLQKGLSVYITGAGSDKESLELVDRFKNHDKVIAFIGKDFLELAALVKQAKVTVCLDTGILHLASALCVPVVTLFGPSDPKHTGPLQGVHAVIRKDFKCGPCHYNPQYRLKEKQACMTGEFVDCMKAIAPHDVICALSTLI